MGTIRRKEALDRLARSARNLLAAEVLAEAGGEMDASLVFHAQQAAEEALKGLLAAHGVEFSRARTVIALLSQCMVLHPDFAEVAVAGLEMPASALSQAKRVCAAVRENLPVELGEGFSLNE